MKNSVLAILVMLFVLPAFTPWLSHGAVHALHDHHATHHGANHQDHGHDHTEHDHDVVSEKTVHHTIHFDAATYFSDYLHVDLQSTEQIALKVPAFDVYDIDNIIMAASTQPLGYEWAAVQVRAPPDVSSFRADKAPIYLSTLRLRI